MPAAGTDGTETVVLLGTPGGVDDDGHPLPGTDDQPIGGCTVQLNVTSDDVDRDRDGTSLTLRVFAPPGTQVAKYRDVMIRGERFRIVGVPFDWSTNRRPLFARHRPRVEFLATRGET